MQGAVAVVAVRGYTYPCRKRQFGYGVITRESLISLVVLRECQIACVSGSLGVLRFATFLDTAHVAWDWMLRAAWLATTVTGLTHARPTGVSDYVCKRSLGVSRFPGSAS